MITRVCKYIAIAALSIGLPMLSGCADKEPDPTETSGGDFVIDSSFRNVNVEKEGKTIEVKVKTTINNSKWYIDNSDCTSWTFVTKKGPTNGEGLITVTVRANETGVDRTGTVKISTATTDFTMNIRQYATSDLHVEGDYPVKPVGATADSFSQIEGGMANTYDDDVNTIFHSNYSNSTTARFPFNMTYRFDGSENIDYIEYVPRPGGGNGCFGEFEVHVCEDAQRSNYKKIGDYNFNFASTPGRVVLPSGLKPTAVKFVVKNAAGNHVSCAEMRFFRYNNDTQLNRELLAVFTDLTCSELLPGVTDEQIEALNMDFRRIAYALRDNSYDPLEKSFRIHEYKAYSNPAEFSGQLMTKTYSNWDNPMGIEVKKGDKILILVGDTHGNSLSVQLVYEYKKVNNDPQSPNFGKSSLRPNNQGTFYALREGVNQIEMDQDGQLFLMYTAVPSAATSLPIKVHIPSLCLFYLWQKCR